MQGENNGRLDRSCGWADGLLYLVPLILAAFGWSAPAEAALCDTRTNAQGTEYRCQAAYDGGLEAFEACEADAAQYGQGCTQNSSGGPWSDEPEVSSIMVYSEPTDVTPGVDVVITYLYTPVCPNGETADANGLCPEEPQCTQGETMTTGFAGTGTSVCSGGCNYTTTHGMDPSGDSGSYVFDGNGFTSSNMPQRYGVWTNDGTTCSASETPSDSITTDQGTTLAFEQSEPNCGTVNGERFCAESLPDGGKCTLVGSNGYICGSASDSPVVPPHDPATTTVTENDAITMEGITGEGTAITISAGTIDTSTPSDGLDEGTTTPEAGSDEAKEEDPTFCENNPEMCDLDDGLGEDPTVPEQSFDLSNMTGNYSSGIANTAACPATETIAVLGTSFEFPWTSFCNFADLIRPFVIAAGFLAAFLFAVRALA